LTPKKNNKNKKKITLSNKRKKKNRKKNKAKKKSRDNDSTNNNYPWLDSDHQSHTFSDNPHSLSYNSSSKDKNSSLTTLNPSCSNNGHCVEELSSLIWSQPKPTSELEHRILNSKTQESIPSVNDFVMLCQNKQHNAGYDAFATGTVFAYYRQLIPHLVLNSDLLNRIFLPGKRIPLIVRKSNYT